MAATFTCASFNRATIISMSNMNIVNMRGTDVDNFILSGLHCRAYI
ncbi:MAG: hypothetical protein GX257_05845 [Clostridiales bacterium]|jgi:uncharacterized protein YjbI with pentapeptide repeats|nr:hypothetical protein [Clostridiales bacterium]